MIEQSARPAGSEGKAGPLASAAANFIDRARMDGHSRPLDDRALYNAIVVRAVSMALRLASRIDATAWPSSGVMSPAPTASATAPIAATTSEADRMAGSVNAIGRDLRAGHIRCSTSSAARVSPLLAASAIISRMALPASSAILSSAREALFLLPAGRPGPPGLPGWNLVFVDLSPFLVGVSVMLSVPRAGRWSHRLAAGRASRCGGPCRRR